MSDAEDLLEMLVGYLDDHYHDLHEGSADPPTFLGGYRQAMHDVRCFQLTWSGEFDCACEDHQVAFAEEWVPDDPSVEELWGCGECGATVLEVTEDDD